METSIEIPHALRPFDGRFGSGPTRIRGEQLTFLAAHGGSVMGTSHRQAPVKDLVGRVRRRLAELFALPAGYEIVLGNGGSTTFWDMAMFSLVRDRSQHLVFGAFSEKFAQAITQAPFLQPPDLVTAPAGSRAAPRPVDDVDVYAWPHNETSTGVMAPVERVGTQNQLVVVDATSGAGALPVDVSECDVYYFAPQKAFGSDGGLWFAVMSPRALERAQGLAQSRWAPATLRLDLAIANSRADQTLNTPAIATLILMDRQLEWMLGRGGLRWASERVAQSAAALYAWAEASSWVAPFVDDPSHRSPCVATLEVDTRLEAAQISRVLRENGIVDVDPYRGVGRNQLRIGLFPSVEPSDVQALMGCLDHVVERLAP